jgi:hypothetical protein
MTANFEFRGRESRLSAIKKFIYFFGWGGGGWYSDKGMGYLSYKILTVWIEKYTMF